MRTKAKRVITSEERYSRWQDMCRKLGPDTKVSLFWNLVHVHRKTTIPVLLHNGAVAVNSKEKVNLFSVNT